jgi:DNA-binding NarL/FixJ family response regulator
MPSTLLIVDDHEGFRDFVSAMLSDVGFEICGEAANGESAVEAVERLQPEGVLLDVQLPGIDGFEVARRLAELPDPPSVVLTSSRDASVFGSRLEEAPVIGFVPKGELSGEALAAMFAA